MSKKMQTLGVPVAHMQALAVSDGELNMTEPQGRGSSHSLNSNSSLPSMQRGNGRVGTVASWAVNFERLLEDPTGVRYFTAFLKSEVSAENILFWQACEKFRQIPANQKEELTQEARSIYNTYLSNGASNAINIDDTARTEEKDLEDPKPDMFQKAQTQIFKLMKFDSYTRFVRSPLYQSCMLADVEGKPLPDLGSGFRSPGCRPSSVADSPSLSDSKKHKRKAKAGKSLPFDVEAGADRKKGTLDRKAVPDKRRDKRGSWGAELSDHRMTVSRSESQCSVKSTNSLELSYSFRAENGRASPRNSEQERVAATGRAEKYCCVFLPDGTASLLPARPSLTIRDMMAGLCEKRGFPLGDVIIYLHGKDKPLSLDQDSSVLRDQQVSLELRVTFTLEVAFTEKPLAIMVKSSKTLLHALSTVLQKHHLRPQDIVVTMSGGKEPLNLNMVVFSLANKRLHLDRVKDKEQASPPKVTIQTPVSQERPTDTAETEKPHPHPANRTRTNTKPKNPALRKTYDMDGLIDLLSKAQCCRADDQRGLLRKEDLVLPQFLQLPLQECEGEEAGPGDGQESPPPQSAETPPTCTNPTPATITTTTITTTTTTTSALSGHHSEPKKPADGPTCREAEPDSDPKPQSPDMLTSPPASQVKSPLVLTDSAQDTKV
ncbi:regulator of G-protein signaling 14-like [Megalops cyprinoides]|uniref:regulator of G-protein signaling 14-like n=1 Tax=Megalops cyprinoides TaxID=118141 RepID=UPI001863AA0F|nr:regulator of G-protein signaling 14-like [Megalops cyprinoides]